jgi:hypothetical protein
VPNFTTAEMWLLNTVGIRTGFGYLKIADKITENSNISSGKTEVLGGRVGKEDLGGREGK